MRADLATRLAPPRTHGPGLALRYVLTKTWRDSLPATGLVAGLAALVLLAGAQAMVTTYGSPLARLQLAAYVQQVPAALRGFYGNPLAVDTLGGFLSWHYAGMLTLLVGLWPILALSRTLAGDLRSGSLEFVATAPLSRRRIALEKVAAHVSALGLAMAVTALAAWLAGATAGMVPADRIPAAAAIGFAAGVGANALLCGSLAFALAPFLGSRAAAGIAGAWMLGGYLVHGYRTAVPAFDVIAPLTSFTWLEHHIPMAGSPDPAPVAAAALLSAALLAVGVEAFARRDLLAVTSSRLPGLPRITHGLRGPAGRSFGDQLPLALAWGIGVGALGFVMAAASRSFAEEIHKLPEILKLASQLFPGVDITSPGGFLQFVFVEFGLILAGLAAASLVAVWASDESSRRLETLLSLPVGRARQLLSGGLATGAAMAVVAALVAAGIAGGAAVAGGDALTPGVGALAIALYGAALAGVGFAVGGVVRAGWAAPAVVAFAIGTFLVDFLAEPLRLPDWVHQAALSTHLGQPMAGTWDAVGIVACVVLAIGGPALGAAGFRRRDVGR